MTFRENLVNARSHIIFIFALFFGLMLVIFLDRNIEQMEQAKVIGKPSDPDLAFASSGAIALFNDVEPLTLPAPEALAEPRIGYAKTAWTYFANNTNPETGLVNSADNYPSTTMWETGSYIIATVSADLLGVISTDEAQGRMNKLLGTLKAQRLFDDLLPNKAYNAKTNELVDYSNKPTERGLGWSALDIARIVGALNLIEKHYPDLAPKTQMVFNHWHLDEMVQEGLLVGGNIRDGELKYDQEGRVGYEQYAAKAMMLNGYDMFGAYDVSKNLMVKNVEDQPIPVDNRLHRNITPAFTVSEPYLFDGLEFGFDNRSLHFATAIYKAQEARYREEDILTAVSETHLDVEPYFAYSSVWGGGEPWAVMSFKGDRMDSKRTIATKVAFAWDAIFRTEYTAELVKAVAPLGDAKKGFPEGIYEIDGSTNKSITANTNAVILAAIAYRSFGSLHHAERTDK